MCDSRRPSEGADSEAANADRTSEQTLLAARRRRPMSELGLNRKLVRAVYPQIDWEQYDREVLSEERSAAAAPLDVERLGVDRLALALHETMEHHDPGPRPHDHPIADSMMEMAGRLLARLAEGTDR